MVAPPGSVPFRAPGTGCYHLFPVRHRSLMRGLAGIAAAAAVGALACGRPWPGAAPPPTFTRDIAPIVFTNCTPCHRPGQAVPFSLLTYADAVKHAGAIADETRQHHMPPWLPEHGEFAILGEPRRTGSSPEPRTSIAIW